MRLQGFILKTEWKDAVEQLRRFVQDVRSVLDNGVSISEHFRGELVGPVLFNSRTAPTVVLTTRTTKPQAVVALSAVKTATPEAGLVSWSPCTWTWTGSTQTQKGYASVSAIAGLAANTDYNVTFWIVGG